MISTPGDVDWVVVSDSAAAKLYCRRGYTLPEKLAVFQNESAHLKERDLTSDRPGRIVDPKGYGAHVLDQRVTHRDSEVSRFVHQLVDYLEAGRINKSYDRLTLIAAPAFLGLMRKSLSSPTKQLIGKEIPKDLVSLPETDIQTLLKEVLDSPRLA